MPRIVVALRVVDHPIPHRAVEGLVADGFGGCFHLPRGQVADALEAALLEQRMPAPPVAHRQQVGVARPEQRIKAQVLGVVGDHQEVKRLAQLDALAVVGGDRLAAREAVGVVRR